MQKLWNKYKFKETTRLNTIVETYLKNAPGPIVDAAPSKELPKKMKKINL